MPIRNFSIIAHIDHGKSTLADRMLEKTGTIEPRHMQEQVLDKMDLERERGITIKMAPVRMNWKKDGVDYELNLIDTPGHVDFSYEVSRALTAVEGVILLVDATQGVQAQTLSVLGVAKQLGRVIIPVVSKIDSSAARVADIKSELALLLGVDESTVLGVSGKTGEGVADLLNTVVELVPPPEHSALTQGLVFDFGYSDHRGIIVYLRVFGGSFAKGDTLRFVAANADFIALEQASQVQNRNVACLKRGGDFIQAPVGTAKNRLVPQPHALRFQFSDRGGNAFFFIFVAIELAQIKPLRAYAAIGGQRERQHVFGRAHVLREGRECIDDLLGRAVADPELIDVGCWKQLGLKIRHVDGGRAAEAVDRLPSVAHDPQALAVAGNGFHQAHARPVHVLVFIDENMAVAQLNGRLDGLVVF